MLRFSQQQSHNHESEEESNLEYKNLMQEQNDYHLFNFPPDYLSIKQSSIEESQINKIQSEGEFKSKKFLAPKKFKPVWSKSQQILFFKIAARHLIKYPDEFQNWKKHNKKKLFISMSQSLQTKTNIQCKSKFYSFKRRYGNRKKSPSWYQKCMKDLIIRRLEIYKSIDKQCYQILLLITEKDNQLKILQHEQSASVKTQTSNP